MANDTPKHRSAEAENQSLFREVLASLRRLVKKLFVPFEPEDSTIDKVKKVITGILGTLLLIIISPVVIFIIVATLLIAL